MSEKKKRKEALQERLELNSLCPHEMNQQEKKELTKAKKVMK